MKKIFMIFAVFVGFAPAFATSGDLIPDSDFQKLVSFRYKKIGGKNYMQKDTCDVMLRTRDRANEYLYANNTNTGYSYEADSARCPHNTQICILGYSTVENETKTNSCWHADVPRGMSGDLWKPDGTIADCSGGKWTPKSSKKVPVFVNTQNKILVTSGTKSGNIIDSLIGTNITNDFDVKCVAYVCIELDYSISYGCNDGTCDDNCPNDTNVFDDVSDDTTDISDDDANDDDANTRPTIQITNRHTAQPYLNALKEYIQTCKK